MAGMTDIRGLIFGVQFSHSFQLLDHWGEIADNILYKSHCFNADFFSNISSQYTTERNLSNPITGNVLTLAAHTLIFKYYIPDGAVFKQEFDQFCSRCKYLIERILSEYKLVIRRVGMVYVCELEDIEITKFAKKYFKDEISGITDFRFAQKEPTSNGQLWVGNNDYINKIYTVGLIDNDKKIKGVTYDFQLYYNPLQSDIRNRYLDFLKKSLEYFKKDIINEQI